MAPVLILCLLINFAQAPQGTQPQEGRDHLLGKVATVRTEVSKFTEVGGEWVEGKRILSRVESYDTEGRKTSREDFTEDGDRIGKLTFTYDAAGRLVESESYIGSERRGVPVKHYKSVHKYGDGGFEDERLDYLDGRLDARTVYTYSTTAKDKRTEMVSYTASGAIMSRTVYSYDAQGNQAEIISYGPDGTVREKIVSSFDAGNRRTKTAHYDGAGMLAREEVFDEKGEVVESTSAESKAPGKYDSRYDARGSMIETDYYDTNGKLRYKVSVEYEYDGEGNWTKRAPSDCTYLADRTVCRRLGVTYRTFTYHEAGKQ